MEKIFGTGFLIPIEKTDVFFRLDVNHLDLTKYTNMIAQSDLRDDLDLVMARYNPKSSHFVISMPQFDTSVFDAQNSHSSIDDR